MDILKMKNLREVKENMEGDLVICSWCEWKGLVPYWAECCPNCGESGAFMFVDDNQKTKIGTVYIPEKDC